MGLCALGILVLTRGAVGILAVLYSINVFLTFSLSLAGLSIYWWGRRSVCRNDPTAPASRAGPLLTCTAANRT